MSKRGKKLARELGAFLKQYARKTNKNMDPNDRRYDRRIERLVKHLDPEELDRLIRQEFDECVVGTGGRQDCAPPGDVARSVGQADSLRLIR